MLTRFIEKAEELGFIKVGFSRPGRPLFFDRFLSWVSEHKNADMSWLERNIELRENPLLLLKGCSAIISLAYPYPSQKPCTPDGYTVSRYSQPDRDDYHLRLKMFCGELVDLIRKSYPGCNSRICVDSAPILERSFACSSGIGFIGKNNMLIVPGYGSFVYLAEILTTDFFEFPSVEPLENQCGACELCIHSCPTGALEEPFQINASKCLSYLTIESEEPLDIGNSRNMGDCFLGCDKCQDVCPINNSEDTRKISLPPSDEFFRMDREDFKRRFGKTALARAGLYKIRSNLQAVRN